MSCMGEKYKLEKITEYKWRIPREGKMRVDGIIFADEKMLNVIRHDESLTQVANVAQLPGIVKASFAMPDIHWGYGFPIGGVAAFDAEEGIVSPGGVGYDINCGVRLLRTNLFINDIKSRIKEITDSLFNNIPTGVGAHRKDLKLSKNEEKKVLEIGAKWAVANGFGLNEDLSYIESSGCIPGANPDFVSERALERGKDQLGTLGSGNHFVEVGYVAEIYDENAASFLGLEKNKVTIIIHTGSRGFGYQVCDDYIRIMLDASKKYGIELPDKQLCCAPLNSAEGKKYMAAMACAANYAFTNRQIIAHWARETFEQALKIGPKELGMDLIYDVAHNIAKFESHMVNGVEKRLCVHRKGATRAFPPGSPHIPKDYSSIGQPVLIPGDMGRCSYVLTGSEKALEETFGSTCHGAGRLMSRHQAKKSVKGRAIIRELEDKGIIIRATGRATVDEEIPEAYKNVTDVVNIVEEAGISKKVAQLRPLGVIKG